VGVAAHYDNLSPEAKSRPMGGFKVRLATLPFVARVTAALGIHMALRVADSFLPERYVE